jgi:uncharacterized protein YidB (DUF937 family)
LVESTDANIYVKTKTILFTAGIHKSTLTDKFAFQTLRRSDILRGDAANASSTSFETNNQRRKQIMGLFDSILGTVSGKSGASGQANPLIGIVGGLLAQSGGLQGLANKFSQSGQGNAFQSWVGMGENQPISSDQIQKTLGSDQVKALAAKMGVDPAQASNFLAEFLPKVVDKLTPAGKIDPAADHQQGLAALLPSLLQTLSGQSSSDQSAQA